MSQPHKRCALTRAQKPEARVLYCMALNKYINFHINLVGIH